MKLILKKISLAFAVIVLLLLLDSTGSSLFAQPSPPGNPSAVAPWENLAAIIMGFIGYGLYKIKRKE